MPVTHLKPNEFAVFLGEKIRPQGPPRFEIKKVAPLEYEMVFTVKIAAQKENTATTGEIPLDEGTFGVFKNNIDEVLAPSRCDFYVAAEEAGLTGEFELRFGAVFGVPGQKGNHGN